MTAFLPPPQRVQAEDREVRAQLGQQARSVQGDPAAAGIFGDVAGRSQPPQPINLAAASPMSADPEALLAALQAQQEQINQLLAERAAAAPGPPELPDIAPGLSNGSAELQAALMGLHARLLAAESALGIDAAQALADGAY